MNQHYMGDKIVSFNFLMNKHLMGASYSSKYLSGRFLLSWQRALQPLTLLKKLKLSPIYESWIVSWHKRSKVHWLVTVWLFYLIFLFRLAWEKDCGHCWWKIHHAFKNIFNWLNSSFTILWYLIVLALSSSPSDIQTDSNSMVWQEVEWHLVKLTFYRFTFKSRK